jgi:hypothetical protein
MIDPKKKIKNINRDDFCRKLLGDLTNAEKDFARQEILIGLNQAGCTLNPKKYELSYHKEDSIFRMNWVIQAILSFHQRPSAGLIRILENKVKDEIIPKRSTLETNYIAVAFEALCFVYTSTHKETVLYTLFKLFVELEKRKKSCGVFYVFLDGTARVDISGHIYNGFFQLHNYRSSSTF